jgi:hypothetical protein
MRGAILSMTILAACAATVAQAGEPTSGSWRPPPPRTTIPSTPRPVVSPPIPRPIMTRPVVTTPRTPPAYPPLSVKIAKPNYNKRTMALIQQNIAMQAAMRNTQASSGVPRCKSSWSEAKLRRKGCLAAPPQAEPVRRMSPAMIADARLCASAVEGADCGAAQAARDRAATGAATGATNGDWQN